MKLKDSLNPIMTPKPMLSLYRRLLGEGEFWVCMRTDERISLRRHERL